MANHERLRTTRRKSECQMHHTWRMVKVAGTQWCAQYPLRSSNIYRSFYLFPGESLRRRSKYYASIRTSVSEIPGNTNTVCSRYTSCFNNFVGRRKSCRLERVTYTLSELDYYTLVLWNTLRPHTDYANVEMLLTIDCVLHPWYLRNVF